MSAVVATQEDDDDRPRSRQQLVPRADTPVNPFGAPTGGAMTASGGNALAAQAEQRAIAEVQSKYLIARRFPRDERVACDKIINTFGRPSLAEVAEYAYSRGGTDISGLSIDAMQAIATAWGNIDFGFSQVARMRGPDGVMMTAVRCFAIDLETGTSQTREIIVRHWRDTRSGGYELKDERDIYEAIANMAQRRVRACLEAVIPKDVQDIAQQQAATTLKAKVDTSPEYVKSMLESFAKFGVTKEHIEAKIQRRIDAIQAGQIVTLKRIYTSLKDGMSTPADWFDMGEAPKATPDANEVEQALAARKTKAAKPKPEDKPEPQQQSIDDQADAPTLDQVVAKINASPNLDVLDVATDLISELPAEEDRAKATQAAIARKEALGKSK